MYDGGYCQSLLVRLLVSRLLSKAYLDFYTARWRTVMMCHCVLTPTVQHCSQCVRQVDCDRLGKPWKDIIIIMVYEVGLHHDAFQSVLQKV